MKIFRLILIAFALPLFVSAQDNKENASFDEIVKAIKNGQVSDLSTYLASSVECDILGQNEVYSKAQTVQVIKDFFAQNKAKSFSVLHQSGKNQVKYLIGSYLTITGKSFRITCFIKQADELYLIQQIRIENEAKAGEG
ncbi:MAG: DUF4783 domain-containing protein [Prevotellaceae bacterium]|jgi:hypothetical protein|nr:DUF4783 domain-containing protein [Prevotellaceae bacterium]